MENTIPVEEKRARPKHNMWSCSLFMAGLAWRHKEKKVVLITLALAGLAVGSSLLGLFVVPAILAVIQEGGSPWQLVGRILAFAVPMALMAGAAEYLNQNKLYGRITVRMVIIGLLAEKMAGTSFSNLGDKKFEELSARCLQCTNSNSQATEAVWETLGSLIRDVLGFAVYLLLLTAVEPVLLAVVLAASVAGYFISNRLNSYGYQHREEQGKIDKRIEYQYKQKEDLGVLKDVKIFGMIPWIAEVTQKAFAAMRAFHVRAENRYIWGRIADMLLSLLRNGAAYFFLTAQVLSGKIDVPAFLLYFTAVGGFTQWVTGILSGMNTLYRQGLDISTVRECLDYPEPFRFEDGRPLTVDPAAPHSIQLEDVCFRYPGAKEDTLSHINVTIRPGEKLAVVGLNGAGKSTLVKLVCGFLDPASGVVRLDGEDIRQYNRKDYYKAFSIVFQDFSVLAASVAENVAQCFEKDIDRAKVADCLEKAGLTEKIASLAEGDGAKLVREVYADGVELSGGQTQRLMLARALYKDAAFIVLDEPTAALDPIAEADMYQKYNEMTRGRLSVYISHRLASTRFCDRILFIQGKGIAEEGTHEELLEKGGEYAKLFEVQSKYYRSDYEAADGE